MGRIDLVELSEEELSMIKQEFFKYFSDPFDFERFLKIFLEGSGMDEVERIGGIRDQGIDLKCVKKGLDVLGDADAIRYIVQAKRYNPQNPVKINDVKALKGTLREGEKGIFITTSRFTEGIKNYVKNLEKTDIILIDGAKLIEKCIDLGIGFSCKPIFNSHSLDRLMNCEKNILDEVNDLNAKGAINDGITTNTITKSISKNDLRTKILPIPHSILNEIPQDLKTYTVVFQDDDVRELKINRERRYFGGVTEIYKKYGLIDTNGILNPAESYWQLDLTSNIIAIKFHGLQ